VANRVRSATYNVLSNYLKLGATMLIMILLTPFIIRQAGQEAFGLWSLILSILGIFSLIDFGFGTSVMKFSAECRGSQNTERRNQVLSTILGIYLFLALVSMLILIAFSFCFSNVFEIPVSQSITAGVLLWKLAVRMVLLNLPLSLFRNLLAGEQKIALTNFIGTLSVILYAIGCWFFLGRGYGIIALAWINLAAMVLEHGAYVFYAFRLIPNLSFSVRFMRREFVREVFSFSFYAFLSNVAALIILRTDPLLVKFFLPLASVAIYAIALKIVEYTHLLTKQFINVLSPVIAELLGSGDRQKLNFILINCTKFALVPALIMSIPLCIYSKEAITLWVGPDFTSGAPALIILLITALISVPQMTASNVLTFTGDHRFTGRAALISSIINIVASIILVHPLGLEGIAAGSLSAVIIVDVFIVVRFACAKYEIPIFQFIKRIIFPLLLPAFAQITVTYGIKTLIAPSNLINLAIQCTPGAVIFIILFWIFAMDPSERYLIKSKLLKREKELTNSYLHASSTMVKDKL
jgi:O-antigen/teichoic acid export membrane protein